MKSGFRQDYCRYVWYVDRQQYSYETWIKFGTQKLVHVLQRNTIIAHNCFSTRICCNERIQQPKAVASGNGSHFAYRWWLFIEHYTIQIIRSPLKWPTPLVCGFNDVGAAATFSEGLKSRTRRVPLQSNIFLSMKYTGVIDSYSTPRIKKISSYWNGDWFKTYY